MMNRHSLVHALRNRAVGAGDIIFDPSDTRVPSVPSSSGMR